MELAEKEAVPRRKTGRPLSFDRDAALEQAMLTFWRYGYETTSIVDLTTAMGVTAPSLYTAFGDKKRLFLEAARRYAGDPGAMAQALDDAETAYEAARTMLISAATAFTGEATPRGCLLASATASGSSASTDVQCAIADIREGIAIQLRARITRDVEEGHPGTGRRCRGSGRHGDGDHPRNVRPGARRYEPARAACHRRAYATGVAGVPGIVVSRKIGIIRVLSGWIVEALNSSAIITSLPVSPLPVGEAGHLRQRQLSRIACLRAACQQSTGR